MITPAERAQIETAFKHHPPTGGKGDKHAAVREACRFAAYSIVGSQPPSRERALAITKLEEAMMWANAGIARNAELDDTPTDPSRN